MNKVEKLIKQKCPNGVDYKKISEVCEIVRGTRVTKVNLLSTGKYPVVSGGIGYMGFINDFNRDENTITIAQYGTAGFVNWQSQKFWANDVCFSILPNLKIVINKYIYYFLKNKQDYLYFISNKSAIPYSIDRDKILRIKIPIPPIEIQEEIVKILDKFSELEAELEAELKLRVKQYEFWREQIITKRNFVNSTKLITKRGKRLTKDKLTENGTYKVYHGGIEPLGKYNNFNTSGNELMIINVGASAGTVGYSTEKFWSSDGNFTLMYDKDNFTPKFLYYFFKTKEEYLKSRVRHAGIPTLDNIVVESIKIPKISIEQQNKIVSILDMFDHLTNNIKEGLPAEIALRKQQYEYYRNKLLTFDELKTN